MRISGQSNGTILLLAFVAAVAACDTASQYRAQLADPAPPAPPETRTLTVGTHRVGLTLPAKWSHDDRGETHLFRRSIGTLSVSDLGPVTPDGVYRAIVRARNAFLDDELERAQEILGTVDLRRLLDDDHSGRDLNDPWNTMRWAGPSSDVDSAEVLAAYDEVLVRVFQWPAPDPDAVFDEGIRRIRHDGELREIASRKKRTVDGRDALLVETWSRRNHANRRRHLFVLNDGYLFVAQTEVGALVELEPAFTHLIETLELQRPV